MTDPAADDVPTSMSWSKVTETVASGSTTVASAGGLVAVTTGAVSGPSTSTWVVWLSRTRPSEVVITTSPRLPPDATATRRRVATSIIVSAESGPVAPAFADTNSNPSNRVPAFPNASESIGASNSSTV